jgi:hypothetical protein
MRAAASTLLLTLSAASAAAQSGGVRNDWPALVEQPSKVAALPYRDLAGPFFFSQPVASGSETRAVSANGFRPFYVATHDARGDLVAAYSLYPFFSYQAMRDGYRWSFLELINRDVRHEARSQNEPAPAGTSRLPTASGKPVNAFDVWPFYFSVETGSPETSYHAVLPLAGTVHQRFGMDRLSWFLFPLYARWEKNHVVTTTAPFPFIRVLEGEGNHGFEFWPIAGVRGKAGSYRRQFYLWPLIYKQENELWAPQPDVKAGFLPFYAYSRDAESRSETFLWPFFGYTDRVAPYRYHQTNYLWPIWVQGRGDDRYVNRWGPFYTHSTVKGTDTTWLLWPLWRDERFTDGPLVHEKRQFFYFLFNDHEERSATHPSLPAAHRTNVWPLFTLWTNGAGRRQFQALSPLEVFFPTNNAMRLSYSAFFALYRFNQYAPGEVEQSALWNFVTYRRTPDSREFHLGPIFSRVAEGSSRRYALGNGLIALQRRSDAAGQSHWRFSFLDFQSPRRALSPAPAAPAP